MSVAARSSCGDPWKAQHNAQEGAEFPSAPPVSGRLRAPQQKVLSLQPCNSSVYDTAARAGLPALPPGSFLDALSERASDFFRGLPALSNPGKTAARAAGFLRPRWTDRTRSQRALFRCLPEHYAETHRYLDHPDHRRRPDRDRPGLRVRLFGHPGLQGAQGRGLPDRAGQFQSGDDHDRPGSGGRDLYRADHARDRGPDHREGAQRRPGRLRAAPHHGRADRAQLRAVAAPHGHAGKVRRRDDRRDRRRDRQGRGPRAVPRRDDPDRARDAALEARQRLGAQAPGPRALPPAARAHRGARPQRGAEGARARRLRARMAQAANRSATSATRTRR